MNVHLGTKGISCSLIVPGRTVEIKTTCCLSEAYGFLKGPMDMLTLYENKYKQEVQRFASEQVGRRRRDDYTDGTVRIPIPSPNP